MNSLAEIDLGHGVESRLGGQVDEQSEIDAVALFEWHLLEQRAPTRVLAGKWLDIGREVGKEERDQGPRHELGDPPALVGAPRDRAIVEALDEIDAVVQKQGAEQPGDETRLKIADVGIAPHDEVALACGQRLPQRLTLAGSRSALGKDVVRAHNDSARLPCPESGVVGRSIVDDEDLVDEGYSFDELTHDGPHHVSHRRALVSSRYANRYRLATTGGEESVEIEVVDSKGANSRPGHL